MAFRLIDFAFVVLKIFMFKVCGIIGISKIEFFNFSSTERVKAFWKCQIFTETGRTQNLSFWTNFDPNLPQQACDFSGIFQNSLNFFFCGKIHFWDSHKNEKKTGPDVETIYFVSIEQKKYNFLQKLANVLVSKKDEVICSSNKYIRKLVNVYIMLFIQNQKKKKTEKELKKNNEKAYHSYHYSLGYYLK